MITSCGKLDAYDNLNGSIILAWGPFGGDETPGRFNIYVNGILYVTILPPFGGNLELQTDSYLLLISGGRIQLQLFINTVNAFFTTVSGLQQTTYSPSAVAPASGNSLRPQNMPPKGFVTNSGTYRFNVVAVNVSGAEVATSSFKRVTVNPASIMLVTPMKRLYPFGETGLN